MSFNSSRSTHPCLHRRLRVYADDIKNMTMDEHRSWPGRQPEPRPLRVFVSSRQREFAEIRAVLARTTSPGLEFLLAEQFFPWDARATDGMRVCETAVERADAFLASMAVRPPLGPDRPSKRN